ncbi:MAG: pyruvate/2-oxoglutarate dehydrogenase complex dihydrolipoamide dehydrogenase (E3) component [Psychromonas sp.]|jgi:pyruvate/2-oxoglutarate dehydrogenase complex dihydrolipoamide dehydrogenase (E3) component
MAVIAKVTLIEKHKMAGDCVNTGCVPSKALIITGYNIKEILNTQKFVVDATINSQPECATKIMPRKHCCAGLSNILTGRVKRIYHEKINRSV